jgi:hypothetical protein
MKPSNIHINVSPGRQDRVLNKDIAQVESPLTNQKLNVNSIMEIKNNHESTTEQVS